MKIIRRPQLECLYLLYFAVVLTHHPIPYLKFVLWLLIFALTAHLMVKKGIDCVSAKNLLAILCSYVVFFGWVVLSQEWAYAKKADSDVISTMLRIVPVLLSLAYYCNSEKKVIQVLDLIAMAIAYFAIVYIVTSPISTWGTTEMGGITNQHRNFSSYVSAIGVIISYSLKKIRPYMTRKYITLMICSAALVVIGGSRGALFSLGVMIAVLGILEEAISKRAKNMLFVGAAILVVVYLVLTNEYLYQTFGARILAMIGGTDASASDRSMYIEVGLYMWKRHPFIGWGVDNFAYYLGNFANYSREVYSHCNYVEILSCYGGIGFILYYWPYVRGLAVSLPRKSGNVLLKMVIVILTRYIIFEFSTISFSMLMYMVVLTVLLCCVNVYRYVGEDLEEQEAIH